MNSRGAWIDRSVGVSGKASLVVTCETCIIRIVSGVGESCTMTLIVLIA